MTSLQLDGIYGLRSMVAVAGELVDVVLVAVLAVASGAVAVAAGWAWRATWQRRYLPVLVCAVSLAATYTVDLLGLDNRLGVRAVRAIGVVWFGSLAALIVLSAGDEVAQRRSAIAALKTEGDDG